MGQSVHGCPICRSWPGHHMTGQSAERPQWAVRLAAEREARSWSVARAAAYLHKRDPAMPDVPTLAKYWAQRWETGRVKPGDRYRHHLSALLRLPAAVFDDQDTDAPAVHFRPPEPASSVEREVAALTGEELVLMAARESGEHARRHGASNVHPVTIDQLEADIRGLAVDFISGLPVPVTLRARAARDEVFGLLDGRQWPTQTRQLTRSQAGRAACCHRPPAPPVSTLKLITRRFEGWESGGHSARAIQRERLCRTDRAVTWPAVGR
jgi:hypothetical protein